MNKTAQSENLLMSAKELMVSLRICASTLKKLIVAGKIKPIKEINSKRNRLFRVSDIQQLIQK